MFSFYFKWAHCPPNSVIIFSLSDWFSSLNKKRKTESIMVVFSSLKSCTMICLHVFSKVGAQWENEPFRHCFFIQSVIKPMSTLISLWKLQFYEAWKQNYNMYFCSNFRWLLPLVVLLFLTDHNSSNFCRVKVTLMSWILTKKIYIVITFFIRKTVTLHPVMPFFVAVDNYFIP